MLSRSTAISSCHFCVESSAMGEMKLSPALLTTAFARPHVCLTKSRRRATSASFDTSAAKASDLASALSSAALTSSSLAWVRPTKTVVAPSSASAATVARPMPPAAPVTITTSSLNRSFCSTASSPLAASRRRALFRRLGLQAGIFLVGQRLQGRQHLAGEQPDVLLREIRRQGGELQHRQKILETEQPMTVHQLLAHGVRAAAQDDALLDEGIDGVFLSRDRALVAQHVLQRFGAEIAGRKQHLERQPQEFVEQRFDMAAGFRARLGVGVGNVNRSGPSLPYSRAGAAPPRGNNSDSAPPTGSGCRPADRRICARDAPPIRSSRSSRWRAPRSADAAADRAAATRSHTRNDNTGPRTQKVRAASSFAPRDRALPGSARARTPDWSPSSSIRRRCRAPCR